MPIFLSDIPALFAGGQVPLDVAVVQLSPPDRHGFCSLGTSVDAARAAVDHARLVVAEINERMPRTHGNTLVPFDPHRALRPRRSPARRDRPRRRRRRSSTRIAEQVASLVRDGATLQMGIGAIPDAVLARLGSRHELGVHTEMFSDRLVDLVATGAVTNRRKRIHTGRIVTSFVSGTRRLFDFVDDNPLVEFHPCDRTNDTIVIRRTRASRRSTRRSRSTSPARCAPTRSASASSPASAARWTSCAARRSRRGGKPIIALPSTAKSGTVSRIVATLTTGAGVVTTRGHVHWVVTEHGAVNLHGITLRERAERMIAIAHPDHRTALRQAAANAKICSAGC